MHNQYDVIIIGGGIYGSGIYYYLTTTTKLSVALIEKNHFGYGATGYSGGLIRTLHPDINLTELAHRNLQAYKIFNKEIGISCDFKATGFATIINQSKLQQYEASFSLLRDLNAEIQIWSVADLKKYKSDFAIHIEPDEYVLFEPESGYADPKLANKAYLTAGENTKSMVAEKISVNEILFNNSKVIGVNTSLGKFNAPCVVIATGAWTPKLLRDSGINQFDFVARPIQVNYFHQSRISTLPPFIDKSLNIYGCMIKPQQILLGIAHVAAAEDPSNKNYIDSEISQSLENIATTRIKNWNVKKMFNECRAYDAYTSNNQGVSHFSQEFSGLFICSGWSGTGFKFVPEITKNAAKTIAEYLM